VARTSYALLVLRALWEIARYDMVNFTRGFRCVYQQGTRYRIAARAFHAETEMLVCEAVSLAACFYYKPVWCLQRSVVATRLLRNYGINARLVIGYRPAPFFSHAWVEVDGRVVNDSPVYKERLQVLCTF
jgi:Transglutaminase-like superfamily